jgi:uncharacterized linocin/CFP29 family protein
VHSSSSVTKRNALGRRVVDVVGPAGPTMYVLGSLSCDADHAPLTQQSQPCLTFTAKFSVPSRSRTLQ